MKRYSLAILIFLLSILPVQAQEVDNINKTVCTLALGYEEIDEIKGWYNEFCVKKGSPVS
jgi:hypothetical protein